MNKAFQREPKTVNIRVIGVSRRRSKKLHKVGSRAGYLRKKVAKRTSEFPSDALRMQVYGAVFTKLDKVLMPKDVNVCMALCNYKRTAVLCLRDGLRVGQRRTVDRQPVT